MRMNSPLRVLFLTLYPETMPSSRLRVYQYLPWLSKRGIEGSVIPAVPEPWFSKLYYGPKFFQPFYYGVEFFNHLRRVVRARCYDLLFVQKGIALSNLRGVEDAFLGLDKPMIFDFDDDVLTKSLVTFRRLSGWLQDPHQTAKLAASCREVIAGNEYLKTTALRFNDHVTVIPTPVDSDRFSPPGGGKFHSGKEVVIGWIGMGIGLSYVRSLEPVFSELGRRYPIRLRLITEPDRGKGFRMPGATTEFIPWSYSGEVEAMRGVDIGIMPLAEDPWMKGKCGLKLFQYMSLGIPSVSSRLGVSPEIIEEGVEGCLASDPNEWIQKLSFLIKHPEKREEMGRNARTKVLDRYSLKATAPRLAEVILRAASVKAPLSGPTTGAGQKESGCLPV